MSTPRLEFSVWHQEGWHSAAFCTLNGLDGCGLPSKQLVPARMVEEERDIRIRILAQPAFAKRQQTAGGPNSTCIVSKNSAKLVLPPLEERKPTVQVRNGRYF